MKKLLRRVLWTMLLLVILGGGAAVYLNHRSLAVPDWYARLALTDEERRAAAGSAVKKVEAFTGRVAEAATAERRGTTVPAPVEAVFSEQEIDSFVDVWLEQSGYRDSVLRHLDDPVVRLHDGMLVLAGKPRTGKRILSMHFRPTLSDDGLVELMLEKLTADDLPVPGMIVEQFGERAVERWETDLAHRLPPLQQQARIAPDGVANRATIEAWQMIAGLRLLRGESVPAVLFLPVYGTDVVPVRCTSMTIDDRELRLQVMPMTPEQRSAFLDRLRRQTPR